jgi:uncharacterized protein YyaL (SSP411 family)
MRTKHVVDGQPKYTNALSRETSPYLLQHKHNPVDWRPWNDASLAEARALDRPIFLSIGYSTCHWCHVMEEESFEDEDIARVINAHFVPIKVDREERPDVDGIYMTAVQALTGHGGWPMSVFLTPSLKPFFAGTYFPPKDGARGASIGFLTILQRLAQAWREDRVKVDGSADEITRELTPLYRAPAPSSDMVSLDVVEAAVGFFASRYDPVWGGLQPAPKFPSSLPIRVLLRHHARSGEREMLDMALHSFRKMAAGGLRDHVGGGFHRYSVDEKWLIPHFEKMLYDNALLVLSALELFQATQGKHADLAETVRDTLAYVERDMTSPDGAFYSATDADSLNAEGHREEGYYFTWTPEELVAELGEERARIVSAAWAVSKRGNFEHGRSQLWTPRSLDEVARDLGVTVDDVKRTIEEARPMLRKARDQRPLPLRDEKILASWNGLMISAFARASFLLDEPHYADVAAKALAYVLDQMRMPDKRLYRTAKDGVAKNAGALEDHAFIIQAALDLFETTGHARWIDAAVELEHVLAARFEDKDNGGFFLAPDDAQHLLAREKPSHDGAEPSGNSVHALNLARLAALLDDAPLRAKAERTVRAFGQVLRRHPAAMAEMLLALEMLHAAPKEIVIVGDDRALEAPLRTRFLPNRVMVRARAGDTAMAARIPLLAGRVDVDKPTVYVCEARACKLPATTREQLDAALT